MQLLNEITQYCRAGYPAFYIHSDEGQRVADFVQQLADALNFQLIEYHFAYGIRASTGGFHQGQQALESALHALLDEDLEQRLIFIQQADLALEQNPLAAARLQYFIEHILRHYKQQCVVVLQGEKVAIPAHLEKLITLIALPLPKLPRIQQMIAERAPSLDKERLTQLATALSGLSELNIEQLLTFIAQQYDFKDNEVFSVIQQQKQQIIEKSGVLEMVGVAQSLEDIGGLENLKHWLTAQSHILNHLESAKQFGVTAPKGVLIAGMPGCGKSLSAKAAAQLFKQPLLRLDMGRLLGKYVGESEHNMRRALAIAEGIAPCVLWIDELEKGFVGMSGNNTSEVSARLLGHFLTWMQEKTAPAFIIATANDITALPPELLRKGRFDEIFYVGFPNLEERKKIIEIHLKKAKQNLDNFDLAQIAAVCRDYSGADIENAIQEAVKKAFVRAIEQKTTPKLSQELLLKSIENAIPLRKTLKEKVNQYEKKFDELYLSPASQSDGLSIAEMIKLSESSNYLDRLKVAEYPEVSEDLLEKLVQDDKFEVQKEAFKNLYCPSKLLDGELTALVEDKTKLNPAQKEEMLTIVATHRNVSLNLLASYVEQIKNSNAFERIAEIFYQQGVENEPMKQKIIAHSVKFVMKLASDGVVSLEVQKILAQHEDEKVRKALAGNSALAVPVQKMLLRDENSEVRGALALNFEIDPFVQAILAEDNLWNVRQALAGNSAVDGFFIQQILTNDDDWRVRQALAGNSAVDALFIQQILINDADWNVRQALASNSNIDISAQEILAKDEDVNVRMALANNPSIDKSVQKELVQNGDVVVDVSRVSSVGGMMSLLATSFMMNGFRSIREALAKNLALDVSVQKILAQDDNSYVRRALASNPNIDESVRKILAQDEDYNVRQSLAKNSVLDVSLQKTLAEDGNWHVRQALAENPIIDESVQEILVRDGDSDVRMALASNPNIDESVRKILAQDEDYNVREALAKNKAQK